jgi:hypothetical protein
MKVKERSNVYHENDILDFSNPYLSYIKFYNMNKIKNSIMPDPRLFGQVRNNYIGISEQRFTQINQQLNINPGIEIEYLNTYDSSSYRPENFEIYNFYYNPMEISEIAQNLNWTNNFEIPYINKESEKRFNLSNKILKFYYEEYLGEEKKALISLLGWNKIHKLIEKDIDLEIYYSLIMEQKSSRINRDNKGKAPKAKPEFTNYFDLCYNADKLEKQSQEIKDYVTELQIWETLSASDFAQLGIERKEARYELHRVEVSTAALVFYQRSGGRFYLDSETGLFFPGTDPSETKPDLDSDDECNFDMFG